MIGGHQISLNIRRGHVIALALSKRAFLVKCQFRVVGYFEITATTRSVMKLAYRTVK